MRGRGVALAGIAAAAAYQCPEYDTTHNGLALFEAKDARFGGKNAIVVEDIAALDGSACKARTVDGVASGQDGRCIDLGVGSDPAEMASNAAGEANEYQFPLRFLPPARLQQPPPAASKVGSELLQARLREVQFGGWRGGRCGTATAPPGLESMYYVHSVPLVGFGSVVEYGAMFLARAAELGAQLVLGRSSSAAWTSASFCGDERSLMCYFNISGCPCALRAPASAQPLELPRRRNPLNMGLSGYNAHGSAWVSGQLAHFFFERLTPATRRAIDQRRASIAPRGAARPLTIGMHIRGGDSCYARRYCPKNLTATFFAEAAAMRARYGANRIVLATDNAAAAELCLGGVMGFDCRTLTIARSKFDASEFIEQRVARHAEGELSGSAVALDALADIEMLADCDMHILLLRSAISRIAYSLSLARKGYPPPLVSMQWPWSAAYFKTAFRMAGGRRGAAGRRQAGGSKAAEGQPGFKAAAARGRGRGGDGGDGFGDGTKESRRAMKLGLQRLRDGAAGGEQARIAKAQRRAMKLGRLRTTQLGAGTTPAGGQVEQ